MLSLAAPQEGQLPLHGRRRRRVHGVRREDRRAPRDLDRRGAHAAPRRQAPHRHRRAGGRAGQDGARASWAGRPTWPRRPRPAATSGVKLDADKQARLKLLQKSKEELEHLKWLYVQGPSGRGRVHMGITNSTGCSSVWASTYPYNPYPFPWANHLFQDAPSLAVGVFEGHMRKMGDHFLSLRKARQLVDGSYDASAFKKVTEEFGLGAVHGRGIPPVPAHPEHRGRRRHDGHRLPEPLAPHGEREADPGDGAGHAGLFEYGRPGLHLRVHRAGGRHVRLGESASREVGGP